MESMSVNFAVVYSSDAPLMPPPTITRSYLPDMGEPLVGLLCSARITHIFQLQLSTTDELGIDTPPIRGCRKRHRLSVDDSQLRRSGVHVLDFLVDGDAAEAGEFGAALRRADEAGLL